MFTFCILHVFVVLVLVLIMMSICKYSELKLFPLFSFLKMITLIVSLILIFIFRNAILFCHRIRFFDALLNFFFFFFCEQLTHTVWCCTKALCIISVLFFFFFFTTAIQWLVLRSCLGHYSCSTAMNFLFIFLSLFSLRVSRNLNKLKCKKKKKEEGGKKRTTHTLACYQTGLDVQQQLPSQAFIGVKCTGSLLAAHHDVDMSLSHDLCSVYGMSVGTWAQCWIHVTISFQMLSPIQDFPLKIFVFWYNKKKKKIKRFYFCCVCVCFLVCFQNFAAVQMLDTGGECWSEIGERERESEARW